MKKLLSVLLAVALLVLPGCSRKPEEPDVFTMMQKAGDAFMRKKGDAATYRITPPFQWEIVEADLVHESENGIVYPESEYEFCYYWGSHMITVNIYPQGYLRINGEPYELNEDVPAEGLIERAEAYYQIIMKDPQSYIAK